MSTDLGRTSTAMSKRARLPVNAGIFGLLIGMFLSLLDSLILATALPTIVADLGGWRLLPWVMTGYLLATAATTPIWGKLGDLYGRTTMFNAAVVLFLGGSALCGLSQSMAQLVVFRVVQGLGSGGLLVGAQATIGVLVPPRENGRVQSMIGIILPIAFLTGPLAGGLLAGGPGWRWAFYVNLPIGAVALILVNLGIRLRTERVRARIDYAGAVLLTIAVLMLSLLASMAGPTIGWASPAALSMLVVAVAAMAGFVAVERRAAEPIIPPWLFHDRNFTVCQVLSFVVGAAMLALSNYLPQYMQFVQGLSPSAGGLLGLPITVGMFTAQLVTGRLILRNGRYRRYPILGGAVMAAGTVMMLFFGLGTNLLVVCAVASVAGIGIGLLLQSTLLITTNSATARDMGSANGTVILLRTVGGSLGISLLGAIYSHRLDQSLIHRVGVTTAAQIKNGSRQATPLLHDLPTPLRRAFRLAVTDGMHGLLVGVALLAAITFVVSLLISEVPLRTQALVPAAPSDE